MSCNVITLINYILVIDRVIRAMKKNTYRTVALYSYFRVDFNSQSGYCRLVTKLDRILFGASEACKLLDNFVRPFCGQDYRFMLYAKQYRLRDWELNSFKRLLWDYVIYSKEE